MEDLNNLIPSNSGWTLTYASGINDSGQICGTGTNPSGQIHAFILTPASIPEPSTLSLLAVAAIGLAAYAWRKRKRSLPLADDGPAFLSLPSRRMELERRAA